MKKERIQKNNLDEIFDNDDGLSIYINMSFALQYIKGTLYVVQNFVIFPESIEPYLSYNTRVQEIVYYKFIRDLYISNIYFNEIQYRETKIYSACSFAVYYEVMTENKLDREEFKKDVNRYINIMKKKNWEVKIPRKILIDEEEIGMCKTCLSYVQFKKKCPYKIGKTIGKRRRCEDYTQK